MSRCRNLTNKELSEEPTDQSLKTLPYFPNSVDYCRFSQKKQKTI